MNDSNVASDSINGIEFQSYAIIYLALRYIEILVNLKAESRYDDCHIKLDNNKYIIAQMKGFANPSTNFNNCSHQFEEAIRTLCNGYDKIIYDGFNLEQAIYVTNSSNPFGLKKYKNLFSFYNVSKMYLEFDETLQKRINIMIEKNNGNLPTDNFEVLRIFFEGTDIESKWRFMYNVSEEKFNYSRSNSKKIVDTWDKLIRHNSTIKNFKISLSKGDLAWPIVTILMDDSINEDCIIEFIESKGIDYFDLREKYHELINEAINRFDLITRVDSLFRKQQELEESKNTMDFVNKYWVNFKKDFYYEGIDPVYQECLVKYIIYKIRKKIYNIVEVKGKVNMK